MPYVPTDDRPELDRAVELLAQEVADSVTNNFSLISIYKTVFSSIAGRLNQLSRGINTFAVSPTSRPKASSHALARAIFHVAQKHEYEGAYLGELNYSITRLIQRVPQIKVESGAWDSELRYWIYACTVEALTHTATEWQSRGLGIGGVFEDIKDEYKRRVNTAYEAAQIIKSGDCYDTPYYTRIVPVVDEDGDAVGRMEVMLERSDETVGQDALDHELVLRRKKV